MILLTLGGAVLSLWLWGALFLDVSCGLPDRRGIERSSVAWALGCCLASLVTFFLLVPGIPLEKAVMISSLAAASLRLLRWRRGRRPALEPFASSLPARPLPAALFLTVIGLEAGVVAFAALVSPLSAWDGWVNWASRANALFIDQGLSPGMYNAPSRLATNQDYPLMLPLSEAWCDTWLGRIDDRAATVPALLFFLALLGMSFGTFRRYVSPTAALGFTALLASVPRLTRGAHTGYADIPLAAAVLIVFRGLVSLQERLASSAEGNDARDLEAVLALAVCGGILPWIKREGWIWWGLVVLSLAGILYAASRAGRRVPRRCLELALAFAGTAWLVAVPWWLFLAVHGTQQFAFAPVTAAHLARNAGRIPEITLAVLERLATPSWNFVWVFAGGLLLVQRARALRAPAGWLILPVTGYIALVSSSYVFSRFEPYMAHLETSIERLLLHPLPLVTWWLAAQAADVGLVAGPGSSRDPHAGSSPGPHAGSSPGPHADSTTEHDCLAEG